jgi:hypothetical protein
MINKYTAIVLSVLVFSTSVVFAQSDDDEKNHGFLTFGVGYGFTSFKGDLGKDQNLNAFNNYRSGISLYAEKRIGSILGVSLNTMFGKVSQSERSQTRNLNFESKVTQFGLDVSAHLDKKRNTVVAPYFSAGLAFMLFDPYGDLDSAGVKYNYWSDGTIRDLPEKDASGNIIKENKNKSRIVRRDYTYETKLTDSTVNYSRSTLVIPLTLGVKFKLSDNFQARLAATYNLTQTDFLDNHKEGGNDSYIYASMSFAYTFGKKYVPQSEKNYESIDFAGIFSQDSDGDGVEDSKDKCPGTPKGTEIDNKGCPLDDDGDGVPNYLDKEKNSKPGSFVNEEGITLTDEMIAKLRLMRDSVVAERVSNFYAAPSKDKLKDIDKQVSEYRSSDKAINTALPSKFKFADFNGDGIIQSTEITRSIDAFFEGELDIRVEMLTQLIDYFFEQ